MASTVPQPPPPVSPLFDMLELALDGIAHAFAPGVHVQEPAPGFRPLRLAGNDMNRGISGVKNRTDNDIKRPVLGIRPRSNAVSGPT